MKVRIEGAKDIEQMHRQLSQRKPRSRYLSVSRGLWLAFAVLLVVFGFAIGGASEYGHHAGLILGGMLAGWKLKP